MFESGRWLLHCTADLCQVTVAIWPLFESPLNELPEAEFSTVQSKCGRRSKDRGTCRWKISTCTRLEVLSEKAECECGGHRLKPQGFIYEDIVTSVSQRHIWGLNLKESEMVGSVLPQQQLYCHNAFVPLKLCTVWIKVCNAWHQNTNNLPYEDKGTDYWNIYTFVFYKSN